MDADEHLAKLQALEGFNEVCLSAVVRSPPLFALLLAPCLFFFFLRTFFLLSSSLALYSC